MYAHTCGSDCACMCVHACMCVCVHACVCTTASRNILTTVLLLSQEDEQELQRVVDAELEMFHKEHVRVLDDVSEQQKQSVINMMHPSLKDMARQNKIMMRVCQSQQHFQTLGNFQ